VPERGLEWPAAGRPAPVTRPGEGDGPCAGGRASQRRRLRRAARDRRAGTTHPGGARPRSRARRRLGERTAPPPRAERPAAPGPGAAQWPPRVRGEGRRRAHPAWCGGAGGVRSDRGAPRARVGAPTGRRGRESVAARACPGVAALA